MSSVAESGRVETPAKVFISYSRKDIFFVERLETALKDRGIEPLVDRGDIFAFEDWWQRIQTLIAKSDTVIFVLSPDAVSSDVCSREITFAASLNKRFAPIIARPVDHADIPELLNRLHFIFFDDEKKFEENVIKLVEALTVDIEWIRKHTEIGQLARRWALAGRPGRSPALEDAEQWIAARPQNAPVPTEEAKSLIAESRRAATRRRNALTGGLALGLLIVSALAAAALIALSVAEAQRNKALIAQSQFLARDSRIVTDEGDPTLGTLLALAALPKHLHNPDRPLLNDAVFALEYAFAKRRERLVLSGTEFSKFTSFSPDGQRLVTGTDKTVKILDAKSGREVATLAHDAKIDAARWTFKGQNIVTTNRTDNTTYVWDASTWDMIVVFKRKNTGDPAPLFSPEDSHVVTISDEDKTAVLWNIATGKEIARLGSGRFSGVRATAFSSDGSMVATAHNNGAIRFWKTADGTAIGEILKDSIRYPSSLAFSNDASHAVVAAEGNVAHILNINSGEVVAHLRGHRDYILRIAYSRDDRRVMTSSRDETIRVWDPLTGVGLFVLEAGESWREEISPDGTRIATVHAHAVGLWDASTGAQIAVLQASGDYFPSFAFSPDGQRLVVQYNSFFDQEDKTRVINAMTGQEVAQLKGRLTWQYPWLLHEAETRFFSADGQRIVTASRDGIARIWTIKDGSLVTSLKGHQYSLTSATYASDGSQIVSGSIDGSVRVWTDESSSVIRTFRGHTGPVTSVSVSADGKQLVSASVDRTARIWDVDSGKLIRILGGHTDVIHAVSFSPDARNILTASADKTARIWDALTGELIMPLVGHDDAVVSASFSPDGSRIVTGSSDQTARIWQSNDGASVAVLSHADRVFTTTFSPSGEAVMTIARGTIGLIWNAIDGTKLLELRPGVDNPLLNQASNELFNAVERLARTIGRAETVDTSRGEYSPNGKALVTASYGNVIQIWDASTAIRTRVLGPPRTINSVKFSPDGSRVIATYPNGTAKTWVADGPTPTELSPIAEYESSRFDQAHSAVYLPNGIHFVTASDDQIIRIWHVPRCQLLIDEATQWLPRELSQQERKKYFLNENPPDQFANIYASVRPFIASLLPKMGDICK
jgi:WD40 repeat protein